MPENNRKMQTDISELENGQLAEQQLPSDFTLVVLAGGASSHMGREKSDLLLDGQTFLEIQIGKGCQLGAKQILISGYRGTQCGEEIVPDRISGQGPLGGLESCFRRAKTEKCLVLGVDTPLVPVEELQNLLKFAMEKADQPVTMLCHNGKEESLIAVYDARPDMSVLHNNEFQDPRFRLSFYGIHICQNPPVRTDIASLHCLFHTSAKLSKTRHRQGRRHPDIQTFCPHQALLRTKFRYTSNDTDR